MTTSTLEQELADASAQPSQHIVVTSTKSGHKHEICAVWEDEHGVINLIVEEGHAGTMSDNLRREALGEEDEEGEG